MNKRTCIKLLAVLVALCLLFTTLPGAAVQVNAAPLTEASEETVFQLDADCQILDYVHEDVFRDGNHVVRLTEEETLDTYVFRNKDGSKTVYYLDEAVKYRDASGTVREKNLELVAGLTGYSTMQSDVQLHIPTNAASGIQLSYGGYDVSIVPQGGSHLPAQRGDKSVGYPNFYGSGTALVYTPTLSGVKEDIILAQYTGVSEFTFLLNTDGLNLYHTLEDRYYLAQTEDAEMKIWLGNIEIFDAAAKPSMGTLTVETVTAGQQYRLTVSADVDFLTDPDTVYPVTIDPTITVSDNTYGANAIEDAPIYEGYPTSNFGTYQYNRAGYAGTAYGRGRTVVRLSGLLNDSGYASASADDIQDVKFYIADASGTTATTVNLYDLTGIDWGESTVTWSDISTYGDYWASASVGSGSYAQFDIKYLAKAWKGEGYENDYGEFILIGANESSVDRALYSSEHSTTTMRPYVVATYTYDTGSMPSSIDVDIGSSRQLTVTGMSGTITWTSSNTSVATVTSAGYVTGTGVGVAIITASAPNYTPKKCTVYVTIADGVYYIKNVSSGKYLAADGGGIASPTNVIQETKTTADPDRLSQLWKIKYLEDGYYSIRPMHKLDMGLNYASGNVNITGIGTSDSAVAQNAAIRWKISYNSNGYVFMNNGTQSRALYPSGGSSSAGASVIATTYSSSNTAFRWTLEYISSIRGVAIYDTVESKLSTNIVRHLALGTTKVPTDLYMSVAVYPTYNYNQLVTWSTSNPSIVSVNASTGAVTANSPGTAIITATSSSFSDNPTSYTIIVPERTFYYDNIYDASFARYPSLISLIQNAVDCADNAYYKAFSVGLAASQAPIYDSSLRADACSQGHDSSCESSCSTEHKEVVSIAREIIEKYPRDNHHISVLWSNRSKGVYSISIAGKDVSDTLAVVINYQDVIHVMSLLGTTNDELEACMAILLMHETAHTMGLEEQYDIEGHDKNGWVCVMERFEAMDISSNGNRNLLQFYQGIKNGTIDAFCDNCKTQLSRCVDAFYINGLD